jgi:methanol metabolism-related c-type cytochrome
MINCDEDSSITLAGAEPLRFHKTMIGSAGFLLSLYAAATLADPSGDPTAVSNDNGKYADKNGNPTYKIEKDGTVDWYTSIGYLRYGANCAQCHGPDGLGSSYAPSLVDSLKSIDYSTFTTVVIEGKKDVNASADFVMPSLGTNKNVMCNLDAIFIYLRARSDGALQRERPQKVAAKPADFEKTEDACLQ